MLLLLLPNCRNTQKERSTAAIEAATSCSAEACPGAAANTRHAKALLTNPCLKHCRKRKACLCPTAVNIADIAALLKAQHSHRRPSGQHQKRYSRRRQIPQGLKHVQAMNYCNTRMDQKQMNQHTRQATSHAHTQAAATHTP